MQFKLGDVVFLKSGGPSMTVSEVTEDGYVSAVWFGANASSEEPLEYQFEPEMLELADEDGFYDVGDEDDLSAEELDDLVAQSEYYKRRGH